MPATIKHAFVSLKADGGDATLVRPSNWNADHGITLTGAISEVDTYTDGVGTDPFELPRVLELGTAAFADADDLYGQVVVIQNSAYQITPNDGGKMLVAESGSPTYTLPLAADVPDNWAGIWVRADGTSITVARSGTDTIDGGTSLALSTGSGALIVKTGAGKFRSLTTGAASSASTNLGYTASTRELTSSTGTGVTLPLFADTIAGLAPSSGGGTTNFLRADGTWAAPSASPPAGTQILLHYNETDTSETTANVAESAALRTYTLAANAYSAIKVEAVVRNRLEADAANRCDFTWRIKFGGVTQKTYIERSVSDSVAGADSGNRYTSTYSTIFTGATGGGDITITSQMSLNNANAGTLLHAFRVYGIV